MPIDLIEPSVGGLEIKPGHLCLGRQVRPTRLANRAIQAAADCSDIYTWEILDLRKLPEQPSHACTRQNSHRPNMLAVERHWAALSA